MIRRVCRFIRKVSLNISRDSLNLDWIGLGFEKVIQTDQYKDEIKVLTSLLLLSRY